MRQTILVLRDSTSTRRLALEGGGYSHLFQTRAADSVNPIRRPRQTIILDT